MTENVQGTCELLIRTNVNEKSIHVKKESDKVHDPEKTKLTELEESFPVLEPYTVWEAIDQAIDIERNQRDLTTVSLTIQKWR